MKFKLNPTSKNKRWLRSLSLSLVVLASRFIGLPPNVSTIGSYGFFSKNIFFFALPVLAFDLMMGGFYQGFYFTYFGFLAYLVLGKLAGTNLKKQILFLPFASFLFFLLSNLGVWIFWYSNHTFQTLAQNYLLALPFYKNTLFGDLFFGYGFMLLKRYLPALKQQLADSKNLLTN